MRDPEKRAELKRRVTETDESYEVQAKKERYKAIKGKRSVSGPEMQELGELREGLSECAVQRPNSLLSASDKQLLQDIKKAVSNK